MSIRVPYETVKSTVTQAFLNLGLSQEKAEKCAEIHTESSLEGIESHEPCAPLCRVCPEGLGRHQC